MIPEQVWFSIAHREPPLIDRLVPGQKNWIRNLTRSVKIAEEIKLENGS